MKINIQQMVTLQNFAVKSLIDGTKYPPVFTRKSLRTLVFGIFFRNWLEDILSD
jgi:hypothetical protein